MSTPARKLLAAAAILGGGLLLALPFRLTDGQPPTGSGPPAVTVANRALAGGPTAPDTASPREVAATSAPADDRHGVATTAAAAWSLPASAASGVLALPQAEPGLAPPLAAGEAAPLPQDDFRNPPWRPGEAGADLATAALPPAGADVVRYVIHDGDTLARLAERYLGDESRALELFDRNRGTLENPYLLPIGAEIEIPRERRREPVDQVH